MVDPWLLAFAAAGICTTTGAIIHGNNKVNKARAEHQEERNRLQKEIERLLKKIIEKDQIIRNLHARIAQLDEEKYAETQKRHELTNMIDMLELRQKKLESILTRLIAFITLRFGKWKQDKIVLKEMLLEANNNRNTIDLRLADIEIQKNTFENEYEQEAIQLEDLHKNRQTLTEKFERLGA